MDDKPPETDDVLQAAIDRAKSAGWLVFKREVIPGAVGYQLKNPAGKYVQLGGSEEAVWRYAFEHGLLS